MEPWGLELVEQEDPMVFARQPYQPPLHTYRRTPPRFNEGSMESRPKQLQVAGSPPMFQQIPHQRSPHPPRLILKDGDDRSPPLPPVYWKRKDHRWDIQRCPPGRHSRDQHHRTRGSPIPIRKHSLSHPLKNQEARYWKLIFCLSRRQQLWCQRVLSHKDSPMRSHPIKRTPFSL